MKKVYSILLILVLTVCLLSSCGEKTGVHVNVYFKNEKSNGLVCEKRVVDSTVGDDAEKIAKLAIKELIKGPKEIGKPVISKSAKLISLAVSDHVATVNVSKHYLEKKGVEELLLRFAIVNTLCDIENIEGVVIQAEGQNIISESTGKELGVLSMGDISFATEDKVTVTLYFPDKNGDHLEKEERKIDAQNALSLEKIIVSELIKGTKQPSLASAIPMETKLISVETKDKVCFVNLSSEFISKTNPGSTATTMALYSIVNSLCSLSHVESVQILINGEAGAEFGNFVLDIPYEANYDLVK